MLIIPRPAAKTLSGYVTDAVSGEQLPGVTLAVPALQQGTVTNNYGFYSLTVASDSFRLRVQYMGYDPLDTVMLLTQGKQLNFALAPASRQLDVVTISGKGQESMMRSSQMSAITLPVSLVGSTPRALGEKDLLKTLQLLPGVKQGAEERAPSWYAAVRPIRISSCSMVRRSIIPCTCSALFPPSTPRR